MGSDAGCIDAGALLPVASSICVPCLTSRCGFLLATCLCDPPCVELLTTCFDPCVEADASVDDCALACGLDAGPRASGEAFALLTCGRTHCPSDGGACMAPPAEAGGDSLGD
jgi:hypothetical protein